MLRRLLIFILSISHLITAFAQDSTRYHIRQFGTEDGLPSNGIKGLQWDSATRFLWIATEAGIVRYNGISFKSFTPDDNPNITNERILFLVRNNQGRIYTADNLGNIFYVTNNNLAFLHRKKISGVNNNNAITLAVSDRLYNKNQQLNPGLFALQFNNVLPVNDTSCYIYRENDFYYLSSEMNLAEHVSTPESAPGWAFKSGGRFFLINKATGLCRNFNPQTRRYTPVSLRFNAGIPVDLSNSILLWTNGMEYPILFYKETAWKISIENNELRASLICNQVPQDALIRFAQYDEQLKTLFLGTDSKGIIVIRENVVSPVRKIRSTASERTSYYSQVALPSGNIMTNEGHVLGYNHKGERSLLTGPFSISTCMQGDSVFWFFKAMQGTGTTWLHRYSFRTNTIEVFPKVRQLYSQYVMTVIDNRLYLANEVGIFSLAGDTLLTLYRYPGKGELRTHFDLQAGAPGKLLIANCYALLQFDINSRKLDTLYADGNYCVRTIWQWKDYLFFGTYGNGLYISKNGVVKKLPLDKNRYLLFTHCFVPDDKGYCWISTNRGLFKASIEDMIGAWETSSTHIYYHYFGRNDGMDMTEMNGGCVPCALTLKDKTISFPTMEGLLWVNPEKAQPVLPAGDLFIDEVTLDTKRIDPALLQNGRINAFRKDLQLRLGFSAWCNRENIYIQYRLKNEKEWKDLNLDNGGTIQLGNLESGNYTIELRKLNGFGKGNFSYKSFSFTVPTPWHQQWWFYVCCLALLFFLLNLYFHYRTRQYENRERKLEEQVAAKTKELQEQNEQLEKNNSIKTRLISIISHDIVTPLKFLHSAGKNLIEKRKMMNDDLQVETIKEITNTSQELQLLSTNILNWIKYQNENRRMLKEQFNLHELVTQVTGLLQSLARQKNLQLLNNTDPQLMVFQFYEPLKILVYNLLTNAIHFTEKGSITIASSTEEDHLIVSVTDEGIGMSPEQIQRLMADEVVITSANVDNKKGHGLGYLIIKDLLKTMEATMDIQSKKAEGTTVSIILQQK